MYGNYRQLRRDLQGFLLQSLHSHGDLIAMKFFYQTHYLIFHPEGVKRVLQDNRRNYRSQHGSLQWALGRSVATTEGETWVPKRRIVQRAMADAHSTVLQRAIQLSMDTLVDRWTSAARQGDALDVAREMLTLARGMISRTLVGEDLTLTTPGFNDAMDVVATEFTNLFRRPILSRIAKPRLPILPYPRLRQSRRLLWELMRKAITQRSGQPRLCNDMISLLLAARDVDGTASMTEEEVRHEAVTLLVTGHETTAATLTWCWYLLSKYPEIGERLDAELEVELGGATPSVRDVDRLPYTQMVLNEVMRLYPPVVLFSRRSNADDLFGGYRIPGEHWVWIVPYVTHRHPQFWNQPDQFDPDRFSPGRVASREACAYIPFGKGPHKCVANKLAMTEMTLALACIRQRFQLSPLTGGPPQAEFNITLRPRGGLWMRPHQRL